MKWETDEARVLSADEPPVVQAGMYVLGESAEKLRKNETLLTGLEDAGFHPMGDGTGKNAEFDVHRALQLREIAAHPGVNAQRDAVCTFLLDAFRALAALSVAPDSPS